MLYADDIVNLIVLCSTRRDEVENKLEEWRRTMEDRGLKIGRKTAASEVQRRWDIGRKLIYQSTWREFGNNDYI